MRFARNRPRHTPRRLGRAAVACLALAFVAPLALPESARASVDDQRREVERIVDELDRLHEQADILAEDWAEAEDNLRQLTVEVGKAEERVAAKEAELAELRGDLSQVALRTLTGSGGDVLGPLFSNAEVYSDALRRDQFSRVALSVGTGTTDDLDEFISDLEAERADLEDKRGQVETLQATIEQKQQQTEELTSQYLERRSQAEARLGELIQQEEERRAAAAWEAAQAAAAEAAASSSSGGQSNGGGGSSNSDSGGGNGGSSSSGGRSSSSGGQSSSSGGQSSSSGGSGASGESGGGSSTPPPPAVSSLSEIAVQAALGEQGKPYRYATAGPSSYDCSGLTHFAWGRAGVYLPRNSRAQAAATPRVPIGAAKRGDLLFYYSPISHVGIYLGDGTLVHAPNSGTVVKIAGVSWDKVTAVGRPG